MGWYDYGEYNSAQAWTTIADEYWAGLYIERLDRANQAYNCHAYAWAGSRQSNNASWCWIDTQEDIYWTDHSYVVPYSAGSNLPGTHVSYGSLEHSLLVDDATQHIVTSKWGKYPRYRHYLYSDPYDADESYTTFYKYYITSVPGTMSSIMDAFTQVVDHEVIDVSNSQSLTGDVDWWPAPTPQYTLIIRSSASLNLNGHSLRGYEIIIENDASVGGVFAESNGVIVALLPTIQSALTYASGLSNASVYVPAGSYALGQTLNVPSGVTLVLAAGAQVNMNGYQLLCAGGQISDLGATWSPADVRLRLNGNLVAHYSNLPSAVTDVRLENIEADQIEVHGGAHSITSDLIIPSGATLSLNATTLNFASGIKLRIDGALSTAGNSTLTSSGAQWFGVEFYNVYNGGTISGCTIENAQYAVYAYNTYLESPVSYNSIQDNSTGVYCSESWIRLYHNLIEYNGYGVRCASYSDPVVEPNNIIRNNQWGVHGDASSTPDLSEYTGTGYNSISSNDYYDVYSSYTGTIYAHGNWWGDYPPYPANSGNVDISDALTSDPNGWAKISPKTLAAPLSSKMLAGSPTSPDTTGIRTFDVARLLFLKGDNEQAQSRFVQLIASYPNNLAGVKSLIFLSRLMHKQNAPVKPTLQTLVNEQPGASVGKAAKLLLVGELLHDRNNVGALEIAESLLGCGDSLFEKHALYNAGNILWYRMGDRVRGESYFRTLAAKFPGDPLAISGLAALGEQYMEPPTPKIAGEASSLPSAFALHPNHPNPFNPATSFEYDLPTPARVSAIVYDLLGREVVELVQSVQPAGSHTVRWDATRMASGVYLLRFSIADEFGHPILNKVNKLLLTR